MADYQQLRSPTGGISSTVLHVPRQAYIPDDPANRDRQRYTQWLAEGNVPDPPPPIPDPPPPTPLELAAHPEGPMDAVTKLYVDTAFADLYARIVSLEGPNAPTPYNPGRRA